MICVKFIFYFTYEFSKMIISKILIVITPYYLFFHVIFSSIFMFWINGVDLHKNGVDFI